MPPLKRQHPPLQPMARPLLLVAAAAMAISARAQIFQPPPGPGGGVGFGTPGSAAASTPSSGAPLSQPAPGGARTITTSRIPESQILEILEDVTIELQMTRGMRRVADAGDVPGVPEWVKGLTRMVSSEGQLQVRFGYIMVPRRLPQLWVDGPAALQFEESLRLVLGERSQARSGLRLRDLGTSMISLSYIDVTDALFALRAMGYSAITEDDATLLNDVGAPEQAEVPAMVSAGSAAVTVTSVQAPPATQGYGYGQPTTPSAAAAKFRVLNNLPRTVSMDKLPVIVHMPNPDKKLVGLVGASEGGSVGMQRDQLGMTNILPNAASDLAPTVSNDTDYLMVLHHPDYPEQLERLRNIISSTIDRPARQVYIEGLVLEINTDAVRDLGIQWSARRGQYGLTLGSAVPIVNGAPALSFARDSLGAVSPSEILNRINALVEQNKAEVLSRPSVMTIDNRQATIRVGTDIPVANSIDSGGGSGGGGRVSFSFQYIPTGILLNVRPRVNAEGNEVSMLIDATVSAAVPNQDLKVVDSVTKATLVSAPTISTRRVQTYARIRDNVPLIIGGLVSRNNSSTSDKVPGIGEVPVVGKLFGHENSQDNRREVIVVLTPSIVNEDLRNTKAQTPKDDDRMDLSGTALLREQYRIQPGDVPDVRSVIEGRRFQVYQSLVKELARQNAAIVREEPFSAFMSDRVPGESIVVAGMLHRLLMRRPDSTPAIGLEQLVLAEAPRQTGVQPRSLAGILAGLGDGKDPQSFFARNPGKALAITFRTEGSSSGAVAALPGTIAQIKLVDSTDREGWRRLLWELNQPDQGIQRASLLIQDPTDLDRIRQAVLLKITLQSNGSESHRTLVEFRAGRMVHIQKPVANWEQMLDASIAHHFFIGEHFYPHFVQEHERQLQALDAALRRPGVRTYLGSAQLP